jgi:hypothetical protein
MQHDVLALLDLLHAIDAEQQSPDPILLLGRQRHGRANDGCLTLEHCLRLAQVIGGERRTGGDQVADEIGAPQARCNFDCARQRHDLCVDTLFAQKPAERVWIRGSNAASAEFLETAVAHIGRNRDGQPAATEIQQLDQFEAAATTAAFDREPLLFDDVETDDAEVADILLHQVRDVVVAHEQHVERHVLAVAHELVAAAAVLEPAAHQQIERIVGEAAGLLDGKLESLLLIHGCAT